MTLGWLVMFAVRRYRVQWGAFASFMSVILGISLVKFLYAADLLPYYAIGIFVGFFANVIVRAVGKIVGGRVGDGLLEISAHGMKAEMESRRSSEAGVEAGGGRTANGSSSSHDEEPGELLNEF